MEVRLVNEDKFSNGCCDENSGKPSGHTWNGNFNIEFHDNKLWMELSGSQLRLLQVLKCRVQSIKNLVLLTAPDKAEIAKKLDVGEQALNVALRGLVEQKVLVPVPKPRYMVNPYMVYKGKVKSGSVNHLERARLKFVDALAGEFEE